MRKTVPSVLALGFLFAGVSTSFAAQSGRIREPKPRSTPIQITEAPVSAPIQGSSSRTTNQIDTELKRSPANRPAGRELQGGEVHFYPLTMRANEFCSVVVGQQGVDVVLTLISPDGKRYRETNTPDLSFGFAETIFFVAQVSGEYQLEIRPVEKRALKGPYTVTTKRRDATVQDRTDELAARIIRTTSDAEVDALIKAEPSLVNANLAAAISNQSDGLRRLSISKSQPLHAANQLLRLTRLVKSEYVVAIAYHSLGNAYRHLSQYDLALKNLTKSLSHMEDRVSYSDVKKYKNNFAMILLDIGDLHYEQDRTDIAVNYYAKSLTNFIEAAQFEVAIQVRDKLAISHARLKDFQKAHDNFELNVRRAEELQDEMIRIVTLDRFADFLKGRGRIGKAIEMYRIAEKTAQGVNEPIRAACLFHIGRLYLNQGSLELAYSNLIRAFRLAEAIGHKDIYAFSIFHIARIHTKRGDKKGAAARFERGLRVLELLISSNSGGRRNKLIAAKVDTLNFVALNIQSYGDNAVPLETLERNLRTLDSALSEPELSDIPGWKSKEGFHAQQSTTHRFIGELHSDRARYAEAELHLQRSLSIAETLNLKGCMVDALISLAMNRRRQGNYLKAVESLTRAESLSREWGYVDKLAMVKTDLARVHRRLDQKELAHQALLEAVKITDSLRVDVTAPNERGLYFATLQEPYDEYLDFLMDQHAKEPAKGHDRTAFEISERKRARALLDSLKEARADIRNRVDANLLYQAYEVTTRLNNAARNRDPNAAISGVNFALEDSGTRPDPENDIAALTAELQRIETAIRAQSPSYSALTQPQPLKLSEIEQSILDDETILLNYALGENKSFLWVTTKGSTTSYTLQPRAEIEGSVKRAYSYLKDGARAGDAKAASDFESETANLSRMLLAPAAAQFGSKRLVIVADGALQYLPFSTLPDPRAVAPGRSPMLASNEIVFAPSASVIGVLRQELAGRVSAAKSVAIFADPVFSAGDERLTTGKASAPASNSRDLGESTSAPRSFLLAPLSDTGNTEASVPRLPFSRFEADAIEGVAPPGTILKAVDFSASRENVLNSDLSQYRIVHFATHGIVNSEYPELSGVVLSLFDEKGEPINGFLRLTEIYNMKLNADLVVLSACQTALGKEVRGEGLIGLTRGFMYAGSPRVVDSLWKVDDVATAELMKIFYQKMLKENMRPAAALRAAKIAMMKQKRWNSPYYWAAFELQGEWR